MRIAVAILAVCLISCTAARKQEVEEAKTAAIECGRAEIEQAVQDLLPVVLAVLNGSSVDWAKMLEGLAIQMGEDALACTLNKLAASHPVEAEAGVKAAKRAEESVSVSGKAKAQTFISEKGWTYQQ